MLKATDLIYREGYRKALMDFAGWISNHSMEVRANRISIVEAEKLAILFAENVDWFMG